MRGGRFASSLRNKIAKPCMKFSRAFKFRLKKPLFIRALRFRPCLPKPSCFTKSCCKLPSLKISDPCFSKTSGKVRVPKAKNIYNIFYLQSLFSCLRKPKKKMDREVDHRSSISDGLQEKLLFPSPITPAYIQARKISKREISKREVSGVNDVEDACRSFENYLMEMIIEEGKVKDLMDVEELLYCWKNLKCPLFVDLVCRFYGELCKDLFSAENEVGNSPQLPCGAGK